MTFFKNIIFSFFNFSLNIINIKNSVYMEKALFYLNPKTTANRLVKSISSQNFIFYLLTLSFVFLFLCFSFFTNVACAWFGSFWDSLSINYIWSSYTSSSSLKKDLHNIDSYFNAVVQTTYGNDIDAATFIDIALGNTTEILETSSPTSSVELERRLSDCYKAVNDPTAHLASRECQMSSWVKFYWRNRNAAYTFYFPVKIPEDLTRVINNLDNFPLVEPLCIPNHIISSSVSQNFAEVSIVDLMNKHTNIGKIYVRRDLSTHTNPFSKAVFFCLNPF